MYTGIEVENCLFFGFSLHYSSVSFELNNIDPKSNGKWGIGREAICYITCMT